MIEVKNLNKSFEEIKVLKGISTTFDKGKTNLIIGQSGSGKTVFLKCLLKLFVFVLTATIMCTMRCVFSLI